MSVTIDNTETVVVISETEIEVISVGIEGPPGASGNSLNADGSWAEGSVYALLDLVTSGGSSYVCKAAHTSAAATQPGVGASWATVWQISASKGDTGAIGAKPAHEWTGTKLSFENSDGSYDDPVNLKGDKGDPGNDGVVPPFAAEAYASTKTIDLSVNPRPLITLAGDMEITLANAVTGQPYAIAIIQSAAGSNTVTWSDTIVWADGTAHEMTATADKTDYVGIIKQADGTYHGFVISHGL